MTSEPAGRVRLRGPVRRAGDLVVFAPTGVMEVVDVCPRDQVPTAGRTHYTIATERVFVGESPLVPIHDSELVYSLRYRGDEQPAWTVPVASAAHLGLRRIANAEEAEAFFQALSVARAQPKDVSANALHPSLARAGNDLLAIATVYPALCAARASDRGLQALHEALTRHLIEELALSTGRTNAEVAARLAGPAS